MKTISSISSLNVADSVKLIALLRAVGKKFYLGKYLDTLGIKL